MWTYLAILFSLLVLVGVFVRRLVVFSRPPVTTEPVSGEEQAEVPEKIRIKKDDRAKVEALSKRGDSFLKVGKDDEAIKCFVQALAIDTLHQETQHKLAVLYLQKQMYGAASALFQQLAELSPDPIHLSHLGLALYGQSDFEAAKEAYQKAVELDDSRPQRFVSLAQVYRALGRLNHAIMAANKAVELDGENMAFLFLLADLQAELGDTEKAKEILCGILEIDPKNKDATEMLKTLNKGPATP